MSVESILRKFVATVIVWSVCSFQVLHAGSFQVDPIRITLAGQSSSALLTVRNEGEGKSRFQVGVFAWDESAQGEMILSPTEDLVYYPNLLTIDPGEERKIRIGTNNTKVAKELSYRIFVEELPPPESQNITGVRILTKMGVPIFIRPEKTIVEGQIELMTLVGSEFVFEVKNLGNIHMLPKEVLIKAVGSNGENVTESQQRAWYILAGGSREYRVKLPKEECSKIKNLTVEVNLEQKSLKEAFPLPRGACKS